MAFLCHETRNPLFVITSNISFLEDNSNAERPSKEVQEQALQAISQSADVMLRLVNDVLDISKLESGKLELQEHDFNLRDTLEGVTNSTHRLISQKHRENVRFVTHISDRIPQGVFADSGVDYGQHATASLSSSTTVTFANPPQRSNSRSSNGLDDHVVLKIQVQDTGVGIPPDQVERLFQPYAQSKLSNYRKHGGTGLGLAIVSKLTLAMGGNVRVTSTGVVLVVDDNDMNRKLLKRMLTQFKLEHREAANGQEAVDVMLNSRNFNQNPDAPEIALVLMDLSMPIMDGYEATAAIRQHRNFAHLPIIALTAATIEEGKQRAIEVGVTEYQTKPIKRDVLYNLCQRYLHNAAAAKPTTQTPQVPDLLLT
eukprot:scaffold1404_cov166-Amphora_coffeaeformis.AAC.11